MITRRPANWSNRDSFGLYDPPGRRPNPVCTEYDRAKTEKSCSYALRQEELRKAESLLLLQELPALPELSDEEANAFNDEDWAELSGYLGNAGSIDSNSSPKDEQLTFGDEEWTVVIPPNPNAGDV